MVNIKKEDSLKEGEDSLKEGLEEDKVDQINQETKESELRESLPEQEKLSRQEIIKKFEETELAEHLKEQIPVEAQKIQTLKKERRVEQLLEVAKDKGIVFAIRVAERMNDSYLLDTLHDTLAEGENYKKFKL